ncbi:DNA repair protein RecO [Hydrocarboniclastica marina]|uniref:DNA repair protein RecO n=1 Tax=Hydrocarboniclastica marina TaxID=2259620 RepID=A0A4P7XLS4_9ALTE|nr:DNA repair protein RecO [Hydrocarboniclastica marina]QCF27823.1 DNA repair protein RecO [Hydrocarboniclastica marina]
MTQRTEQEPAFILHRRPFQETSFLLDILTLSQGRLSLVARGASRPKNPWKAQLQPFQPLLLSWIGRTDLKTLTDAELRSAPPLAGQDRLYCGLYLNELIQRLLPQHEPVPELFAAYLDALETLRGGDNLEPGLRLFEQALVATLGYGFRWDWATDTDTAVQTGQVYGFDPQQGVIAHPGPGALLTGLAGEALLAITAGDVGDPARNLAKRVMRCLIDYLLQGQPLQSRRLFQRAGSAT